MREHLIRVHAPAVAIVAELEAPSRIIPMVNGAAERGRLLEWIESRPQLAAILELAILEGALDPARSEAWSRRLAREPGGIAQFVVEQLLCRPVV